MNTLDLVIVIILVIGFVRGAMRGLIVELASLIALIAGIYGAIHFSNYAIEFLTEHVSWNEKYIEIAGFGVTFLIIVILILLIGKLLTKLAGLMALGIINRILGGIFGFLKLAFILSVVIMFANNITKNNDLLDEQYFEDSILFEPLEKVAPLILPPLLEQFESPENTEEENTNVTT
ncbi:CvpA family protein [Mesonia sp.]|uniref:CvpA family protein n=1 Tax=Mesonia sp. TaxID=1960830 RepID=UPI0017609AE5|nr:CvpA family protein [Mesonia sp.]HIB36417.1 CvpA family protein [Mesonia sp.]HIO26929.1 CvpA family protein [Flavobacteriaceae bacterium]